MSDLKTLIRASISPFITGPEADALIDALTSEALRQEKVAVASFDQLFLSTASGGYLAKKAGDIGFSQPSELGLQDFIFRRLAIDTYAQKQITSIIHNVLETFYGVEAVRANVLSAAEPYSLTDGMQLLLNMDGVPVTYTVKTEDYPVGSLPTATAESVAAAITKALRLNATEAFAQEYVDFDTGLKYVRLFSSARGPTSYIKILGGEMEIAMGFPTMVETVEDPGSVLTWTNWQITRNGTKLRFTWGGNQDPGFDEMREDDIALIYGPAFVGVGANSVDLTGSFLITAVNDGGIGTGYFEIESPIPTIDAGETISVNQGTYNALRIYRPSTFRANSNPRYALAWEPVGGLLKIYIPATPSVIQRGAIGGAHIKLLINTTDMEGTFGSASVDADRITVLNQYAFQYPQNGYDNWGFGGDVVFPAWAAGTSYFVDEIVTYNGTQWQSLQSANLANPPDISPAFWEATDAAIEYIKRENNAVTVVMVNPHGLRTFASSSYPAFSSANAYVEGDIVDSDGFLYVALQAQSAPSTGPVDNGLWALYSDDSQKTDTILTIQNIPEATDSPDFYFGPYIYDPQAGYTITRRAVTIAAGFPITAGSSYRDVIVDGQDEAEIPDVTGYAVIDLNLDTQEVAPIIGSTNNTVIFNPAYSFRYSHAAGSEIRYLSSNRYEADTTGGNYPFYVTGTYPGRKYCQDLLQKITALGIKMEIIVIYPGSLGWGGGNEDTRVAYENTGTNSGQKTDEFHNDAVWIYGE